MQFSKLITLLSLLYITYSYAQTCSPYKGEVTTCNPLFPSGTLIYVPANKTYESFISEVNVFVSQASAVPDATCRDVLLPYVCANNIRICEEVGSVRIVVPGCRSVCTNTLSPCAFIFQITSSSPNCTEYDNSTASPKWLDEGAIETVPTGQGDRNITCGTAFSDDLEITCPYPLAKDSKNGCGLMCPDPVYTDKEYLTLDIIVKTIGWISFLFVTPISVTYLLNPKKKKMLWPSHIPYFYAITCAIHMFFVYIVPTLHQAATHGHYYSHWCANEGEKATQTNGNPICTMQGVIGVYMASHIPLLVVTWCLLVILQIWKMTLRVPFYPTGLIIVLAVVLLPLIPVIIVLSHDRIGFGGGLFCSVYDNPDPNQKGGIHLKWLVGSVLMPPTIFFGILCIQLFIILFQLYRITWRVSNTSKQSSNQYEIRLAILQAINIAVQIPLIVIGFYGESKYEKISNAYTEWVSCELSGATDCKISYRVPYGLMVLNALLAAVHPMVVTLIFNLHVATYRYWRNFIFKTNKSSGSESNQGTRNRTTGGSSEMVSVKNEDDSSHSQKMEELNES